MQRDQHRLGHVAVWLNGAFVQESRHALGTSALADLGAGALLALELDVIARDGGGGRVCVWDGGHVGSVEVFPPPLHKGLGALGDAVVQARLWSLRALKVGASCQPPSLQRCGMPAVTAENPSGEEVIGGCSGDVMRRGSATLKDEAECLGALGTRAKRDVGPKMYRRPGGVASRPRGAARFPGAAPLH